MVALCRQGAEEDDMVVCNHLCVDACMYLYMQTYTCTVACVDTSIRIISVGVCSLSVCKCVDAQVHSSS